MRWDSWFEDTKGQVINYKPVGPGYFSKNPKKFRDPTKLPKIFRDPTNLVQKISWPHQKFFFNFFFHLKMDEKWEIFGEKSGSYSVASVRSKKIRIGLCGQGEILWDLFSFIFHFLIYLDNSDIHEYFGKFWSFWIFLVFFGSFWTFLIF